MKITLHFLKKAGIIAGLIGLVPLQSVFAQTPQYAYVSNSTATNSIPLGGSAWADQRNQWVYGVGDFGSVPGGMAITTIYLRQGTISDPACTWTNFHIKLGQPNMTSGFNGTWVTGLTTVMSRASHSMGATSANQWLQFDLDVPFMYDPTKPLVVETYQTATPTGRKTLQAGGTTSNMSGNTQQYGSTSAGSGTPRRYSYSLGFDLISMNIDVTEINFVNDLCQEEVQTVSVKVKNTDVFNAQTGFWLEYSINGVHQVTDVYSGTIQPGDSAWHTFSMPVNSANAGNFTLTANISGKTPIVQHPFTVKPAPLGSYVVKGTPFAGSFNSGDALDPDIVAYGDNINYEIVPPTGYNNSGYGSTWEFSSWTFLTPNGTSAGGAYSNSYPNASTNAGASYTPVIGQSDSTFLLCYSIKSLANGCSAPMICRELFVAPRPVPSFAANPSCEGAAMSFDNNTSLSSGSAEYLWDFGDGNTSELINPSHIYTTAGTYDVELTATSNYGYSETFTMQVTVYENPTAEFTYQNVCEGTITPFTDASIIPAGTPTYEWDFGDGSAMGSGPNPTHQYSNPDVYRVTMTVTANGCSGSASNYVTYAPRAVPDFTPSYTDCNNDPVNFINASTLNSGQMGFTWDFGDNTTSTSPNPTHLYSSYGTINITLTVTTDLGCTDMISKQITLTEAPIADFSSAMLCDKDDADFLNLTTEPGNNAVTSYEWWFSDGSTYTTKDVNRSFPSVGQYTVKLKAIADNGCIDEVVKSVSVDEEPGVQFYADPVCEGDELMLKNASTGNKGNFTSSWDFGGGMTSTDKNPTVTLPAGSNPVTLTVTTPSGCEASLTRNVEVTPKPVINSLEVVSGQKGDGTMNLIASVTPANVDYTIFWGDGGRDFGTATGNEILGNYQYLSDRLYEVTLQVENNDCAAESTESIYVFRTGVVNLNTEGLKVYPNPNNGRFNLDLSGLNGGVVSIAVTSANGQAVNGNVVIEGETARLDLSGVAAGVYLVSVTTDGGVYTARITVNN